MWKWRRRRGPGGRRGGYTGRMNRAWKAPRRFDSATVLLSRLGRKCRAEIKEIAGEKGGIGISHWSEQQKNAYPRTSHTRVIPRTADTTPAIRREFSGDSSALAASRFAAPGKAAKISPSMANTSPIATMKSDIADQAPGYAISSFRSEACPTDRQRIGRNP